MFLLAATAFALPPQAGAPPTNTPDPNPGAAGPAAEAELPPLVKEPALLAFIQAPYPPEAEAAGLEGTVKLLIDIDETGAVTRVEVLQPAGEGFDEAAAEAARAFRFSPAEDDTGPVPVSIEFDYGFRSIQFFAEEVELALAIEGTLLEMATRKPVEGAVVQVLRDGEVITSTRSDAEGRFSLRGMEPGPAVLAAFTPEHRRDELSVDVTAGEVADVKLWLKRLSYAETGIIGMYEKERAPEVTRRTISMEEVRRVPGTFGDPVRIIQSLPGAARAPFSTGLLVLRGANPEDSNVYVDGVEVPLVYHLGGFRSILNPGMIAAVDYLPGTYSAKYGRSTGGVVDIRTQTEFPEQTKLEWRTDVLDTAVYATGQVKKKVGFSAGIRRSYLDVILGAVLADQEFYAAPRWFDYQLKVQALDTPDELSAFVFGFNDDLIVRTSSDAADQLGVSYGTHRLVLRWRHPIDDTLSFEVQPVVGYDTTTLGFGNEIGLDLSSFRIGLRAALAYEPSDDLALQVGLDSEASRNSFAIYLAGVPVDGDNPLSEEEPIDLETGAWQGFPDPFVEATIRPLADRERLAVVAGLRLDAIIGEDSDVVLELDPRFGGRFEVFEGGTLKAGTGIYHQPPQGILLGNEPFFSRAWSSEIGWEQKLGRAISADVTGFYRDMDNLAAGLVNATPDGIGRAYGLEVMVRHARIDRFFGWVSYTLSKSERNDTPQDPEGWYPFDYDQTHILTGVAGYRLPLDLEVSGRAQYVTGNPYTPYAGGLYLMDEGGYLGFPSAATNSERMAPYYAVDLRISKLFTYKFWQLEVFADVLNAVHGENPEFLLNNYDYTESTYINGLPIVPSIGFQLEVNL